jgi:hypothetical protein
MISWGSVYSLNYNQALFSSESSLFLVAALGRIYGKKVLESANQVEACIVA